MPALSLLPERFFGLLVHLHRATQKNHRGIYSQCQTRIKIGEIKQRLKRSNFVSKGLSMFTLKTHQMRKKGTLSNPQFAHPKVPQLQKFGRICATPTRQRLLQALPQDQHCTSWNHLLPIFQTIQWVHMGSMFVFGCVHGAIEQCRQFSKLFNQHSSCSLCSNRWTNIEASWWHFSHWLWRTSSLEGWFQPRKLIELHHRRLHNKIASTMGRY